MKAPASCDLHRREFFKAAGLALALAPQIVGRLAAAAGDAKVKIGVIGSGKVGSNIGRSWAQVGHQVMFASRDLEHDKQLAAQVGPNAKAGTAAEAAAFGDVVLLSVPYGSLPELSQSIAGALQGKLVLDACNPFPERDGEVATQARQQGAGHFSAQLFPGAHIVRAFNAISAAHMGSARDQAGKVGMPMAGDDRKAVALATSLIRELGYEPILIGGLDKGKYLMPGTPLAGEHSPDEVRKIASSLQP